MMSDDEHKGQRGPESQKTRVRDLVDFYRRWPEFRGDVAELLSGGRLSPAQNETLSWMVALLDRIGENDLNLIGNSGRSAGD